MKLKMIVIILITIICFLVYILVKSGIKPEVTVDDKPVFTITFKANKTGMTGGNTEELEGGEKVELDGSEGYCSYCMVDDDVFIKYYFERKDDNIYKREHLEVVGDKIVKCRRLRERDMLEYLNKHVTTIRTPKLIEGYDIPFDEEIFKKIRLSKWYKPEEVQMKVLVLERLPYGTLSGCLLRMAWS